MLSYSAPLFEAEVMTSQECVALHFYFLVTTCVCE